MDSQEALSHGGENADRLKDMAAQLLVILSAHGDAPTPWDQLQGTLAQVATCVADPRITVEALEDLPEGARVASSLQLGHAKAEALLQKIMECLQEEVRALEPGKAISRFRELLLVVAGQLDMLPLRDSDPKHIIDEKSNFCDTDVAGIIMCSPELSAPSAHYTVVSIVGAQSSGKSYLLNRLFGTKFPEMIARTGRKQTTKGIMMSRCIGPSLLVLDVEGFDGREKGQDTLFENQAALFALTVSDIMLVNMNVFDVGREKGGATLLFETIFKERTKLPEGLTNILVVLRMYDGETELEILKDDVMKSLEKMWKSVNAESLKFENYIKVDVVGLPDKKSKDFSKEVASLRRLLSKSTINHKGSAKVPASSFSLSSRRFWEKIKSNEKLDIPSHKETLASLFCRRTADNALILDYREDYKQLKAEESPQCFKERSDTLSESLIMMYDHETENYDPKIRDDERQYMVQKLSKVFVKDSQELMRKMLENGLEKFKGEYAKIFKNMEENDVELNYDDQMVHSCVKEFMTSCEVLKEFDSNYVDMKCGELEKQLQLYTIHQFLTIKEIRWMKAIELAQQRADKNLGEVLERLDETVKERQHAEEEMTRLKEKQLKDELEYTRNKLAEQQKHAEKMLADKQEREEKMLSMQKEEMEKMLARQAEADKMRAVHQEQMEKILVVQQEQIKRPTYSFSLFPSWLNPWAR